jgi:elongation factor G
MSEPTNTQNRLLVSAAISPIKPDAGSLLQHALNDLASKDRAFNIAIDPASQQVFVHALHESHLDRVCDQLYRDYAIEADIGEPGVIYLETIRQQAESEGKYIRQTGGHGNYAHVKLRLEPNEASKGFEFTETIPRGLIPKKYVDATEQGIREAALTGVLAGCEMTDMHVTLFDGSYHNQDSNEMAFRIAAAMAFKEAAKKAKPVLLEPIMAVEVSVPEERTRLIMAGLTSRRARITGIDHGPNTIIHAIAPLAEMLGYTRRIHSSKLGPVECSMRFVHHAEKLSRDEFGDGEAGVPASKPAGPKPRHGFAAADPDSN